jgi:hypothetical protein
MGVFPGWKVGEGEGERRVKEVSEQNQLHL